MDKKRMNPIVAQRDDMIGRPSSDSAASNGSPRKEKNVSHGGGAGGMRTGTVSMTPGSYTVTVGAGASALAYQGAGGSGIVIVRYQ